VSGVRIWKAHLDSIPAVALDELIASLDGAERERAARFHFEPDRRNYIASRGLLRRLVGTALDESASALIFEYGPHGKPAIDRGARDRTLHFNLSHSTGWAMFALAWDRAVGIDLECGSRLEREDNNLSGLAARILSPLELEIWDALPDAAQRHAAFLRAWTRKEAYAKATGQGLFDELHRIEVALDAAAPKSSLTITSPSENESMPMWVLHDLPAPESFAAALAVQQTLLPSE
jgi:4'-phosphopantetheinyl transferase